MLKRSNTRKRSRNFSRPKPKLVSDVRLCKQFADPRKERLKLTFRSSGKFLREATAHCGNTLVIPCTLFKYSQRKYHISTKQPNLRTESGTDSVVAKLSGRLPGPPSPGGGVQGRTATEEIPAPKPSSRIAKQIKRKTSRPKANEAVIHRGTERFLLDGKCGRVRLARRLPRIGIPGSSDATKAMRADRNQRAKLVPSAERGGSESGATKL